MLTFESIKQNLITRGISFEEITFLDEAVAARKTDSSVGKNYDPKAAIKTLIITTKSGFKAVIIKGDDRINNDKLKNLVGKWSVINQEELMNKFGFLPGCVCPLILDLPFLIDKETFTMSIWSMGAGDAKKGLNIKKDITLSFIKNFHIVSLT